jgi:hypothetical protein
VHEKPVLQGIKVRARRLFGARPPGAWCNRQFERWAWAPRLRSARFGRPGANPRLRGTDLQLAGRPQEADLRQLENNRPPPPMKPQGELVVRNTPPTLNKAS